MSEKQTTPPPHRQRLILTVLIFAQLLIWLDNTILSTAFETLADPARGLGATPGQLQWTVGSYTLTFATLMFTSGALGDRLGHRTMLLSGMAVFGASSVWAAYADSAGGLIAARAVMGVGSALIMPATLAIVSFTFAPKDRPKAFAGLSAFAGIGVAGGPILAGFLLGRFWWGSVFLVNVPVVLAGIAAISSTVPNFRSPHVRRLDPAGLVLSVTGLGALAYGLIRAGQEAAWGRPAVWGPIAVGVVLLGVFTVVELRLPQPSFNPRLLAQRQFAGGNVALLLVFFAMTSGSFYGAFYLQGARRFSAFEAGLAMLPTAIGVMIGAPLAIRLSRRTSVRAVCSIALTTAAGAIACNSLIGLHTPLFWVEVVYAVLGTSIGMVIAPVSATVLGSLPLEQAGAGSAVTNTMRQTGSVLGIAVGGTVVSIVYRRAIGGSLTGLPAPVRDQAEVSAEITRHIGTVSRRPDLIAAADRAFVHTMHVAALWTAASALIGAAVLAFAFKARRAEAALASQTDDIEDIPVAGNAPEKSLPQPRDESLTR